MMRCVVASGREMLWSVNLGSRLVFSIKSSYGKENRIQGISGPVWSQRWLVRSFLTKVWEERGLLPSRFGALSRQMSSRPSLWHSSGGKRERIRVPSRFARWRQSKFLLWNLKKESSFDFPIFYPRWPLLIEWLTRSNQRFPSEQFWANSMV